jgi:preprotein translocase subunit SecD
MPTRSSIAALSRCVLLATASVVLGCSSPAPPTAAPTPLSAPRPTSCWVLHHGEYALFRDDGSHAAKGETEDAARLIDERLRGFGLAEHVVSASTGNSITVDLPALDDEAAVRQLIRSRGDVVFAQLPADVSVEPGMPLPTGSTAVLTRDDIQSVAPGFDVVAQPAIDITLTAEGRARFAAFSGAHVNEQFAIAIDGDVVSAPIIRQAITGGELQVSGGFGSAAEVNALVSVLRLPAMPGRLEEVSFAAASPPAGCAG